MLYVYEDMLSVSDDKGDVPARVSSFDINCKHIVIYYDSFNRNEVILVNKQGSVIGVR